METCHLCSGILTKGQSARSSVMDKLSDFEEGYVITIKKGGFFSSEEIKVRLCFGCGKGIEELGIPYTFISYKEIYLKEKNLINNKEAIIKYSDRLDKDATANDKRRSKEYDREEKRIKNTKKKIVNLLKKQKSKMPTSDIDAFLKHKDVDEIKDLCEEMYHDGKISRTGNYRYFVLSK